MCVARQLPNNVVVFSLGVLSEAVNNSRIHHLLLWQFSKGHTSPRIA
jgi:hypothetical protein